MILFGDSMLWIVAGWMLACQTDDNADNTEQRDWKPSIRGITVGAELICDGPRTVARDRAGCVLRRIQAWP